MTRKWGLLAAAAVAAVGIAGGRAAAGAAAGTAGPTEAVRTQLTIPNVVHLAPGQAADFTIRIPVELDRMMPDVARFGVGCDVISLPPESKTVAHGGSDWIDIPSSGSYRGTVIVRAMIPEGWAPPSDAATLRYDCALWIKFKNGEAVQPKRGSTNPGAVPQPAPLSAIAGNGQVAISW